MLFYVFPAMLNYIVQKKGHVIDMTRGKIKIRSVLWLRGKNKEEVKNGELDKAGAMEKEEKKKQEGVFKAWVLRYSYFKSRVVKY